MQNFVLIANNIAYKKELDKNARSAYAQLPAFFSNVAATPGVFLYARVLKHTRGIVQHWLSKIPVSPLLCSANGSPGTSDQPPR